MVTNKLIRIIQGSKNPMLIRRRNAKHKRGNGRGEEFETVSQENDDGRSQFRQGVSEALHAHTDGLGIGQTGPTGESHVDILVRPKALGFDFTYCEPELGDKCMPEAIT